MVPDFIDNRAGIVFLAIVLAGPTGLTVSKIHLLLEFQSSAEPMSLRLLEYLSRIYRRQRRDYEQLRPVVPIVIYNGIPRWREDPDFSRHFVCIHDSLRPYLPLYRYILIDEGRYDKKLLRKLKGAVAAFFRIDTVDLKNRTTAADSIIEVLREEGREEGFELGHQKGYGQGELKEKQNSLLQQMAKKFSLVPEKLSPGKT